MTFSFFLRGAALVWSGVVLTACDSVVVDFAQPFPAHATNLPAFPRRHQAVYTAPDSTTSLCIGSTAVWLQEVQSIVVSRHRPGSAFPHLGADSTYRSQEGCLHYLRPVGKDSVRDSWLSDDTIFTLAGARAGRLRRFQGRYYLSTPGATDSWQVQRLEIDKARLVWQSFGHDTLRLMALDPATVHYGRSKGTSHFQLAPAPGPQTRRVGSYAGLWETEGEYVRRR